MAKLSGEVMELEPKVAELSKTVATYDDKLKLAEELALDCPKRNEEMGHRVEAVEAKIKKLGTSKNTDVMAKTIKEVEARITKLTTHQEVEARIEKLATSSEVEAKFKKSETALTKLSKKVDQKAVEAPKMESFEAVITKLQHELFGKMKEMEAAIKSQRTAAHEKMTELESTIYGHKVEAQDKMTELEAAISGQ